VLDYNMPIMTGLECVAIIKTDQSLKSLPVSVLSTSCSDKEVGLIKMYGVDCHKKPDSFEELTLIVSKILF
jgi:CheY-like chemotaxis protein